MAEIARVQRNFKVTLPASARKQVPVRVGDLVRVQATEDGILLCPVETVDRAQAWFWSKPWQAEERKVKKDIRGGRLKASKSVEAFLKGLNK
jgi:AbrB family looped-hinge helix DNA binding protein